MYRKTLINLTAITLAFSMVVAAAVTAHAAESPDDRVNYSSAYDTSGTNEVYRDENDTSSIEVEGANVEVIGDVVSTEQGKSAVKADHVAKVTVDGDVTGTLAGVEAMDNSDVTVNGNVNGSGYEGTSELSAGEANGSKRTNKTQGSGIVTDGTADVIVNGDAIGLTEGVLINPVVNGEGGKVVVTGTLGSIDDSITRTAPGKIGIVYHNHEGNSFADDSKTTEEIAKEVLDSIPDIYAYAYKNQAISIAYSAKDNQQGDDIYEKYLRKGIDNKIHYIIKTDDSSSDKITDISGYESVSAGDLNLMSITLKSALKVAVAEGYEISSGDSFKAVDNGDGTYTIKISNFSGNITIKAVLKQIKATSSDSHDSDNTGSDHTEVADAPFIFATFTITDSNLASVLGASRDGGVLEEAVAPTQVIQIKAGALTASQYKNTFINSVKTAPANAVIRLETAAPSCIDKMMMEALAERSDITFVVAFPVEGNLVEVTIPAGYDVMSLIDEKGYCGFLYLNSVFNK